MWLLLYLPESKAGYLINLCVWYEGESVLETISSDKVLGARLSHLHWISSVKKLCKKKKKKKFFAVYMGKQRQEWGFAFVGDR